MTSAFITVLRFCCINSSDALRFERYSQLHIGELVLTVGVCADSLGDLAHCNDTPSPSLPAHDQPGFCTNCGGDVQFESLGETSEWLTDMKEIGGFRIEARPVVNRVIPPLRQLFFSLTCGRHEFTASL